jgi:N-methylhydantoinase A/oxoprolinase/acetone carboxylase beta subunit
VTDANLLLGRLPADAPLAGALELDRDAAERAVAALADRLGIDPRECAHGIVRVAESEMLGALRLLTVERGIDPRRFALMPFGGAGPLHACAMARELGIRRVLCPRASGVLCALGLAAAAPRRDVSRTVLLHAPELTAERVRDVRDELIARADGALAGERARLRVVYELRYVGQSFELAVERSDPVDPRALTDAFATAHEQRYGYSDDDADVELVTVRVSVWGAAPELAPRGGDDDDGDGDRASGGLAPGARLAGPTVRALPEATLYVPDGWSGVVDEHGTILLEDAGDGERG